ncbi:hypothetical protein G6M89_09705 [Natronolimnobius sp. AArcel1]|uniref:HalOD1 output domain-containing protein n=1 Tax=Natronolimnobius sp. AArcel1 TaxID=1679093 RepID=UPI0013ED89DD|nr:HalOD1 output domain-containing protein [Natronolimnobius sp. AArcel1]NGM69277.1 hypothetical protein [Natronolimnobius sp. AArcel1]
MNDNSTHAESPSVDGGIGETDTGTVLRTAFEIDETDAVVVTIVTSVATIMDEAVDDMPPLYDTIDTEAVTELLAHGRHGRNSTIISFFYHGCQVTISSRGDLVVAAPT